jgi:F0F1-type ATP synthase assembly protein I
MDNKDNIWWRPGVALFIKISGAIAVPVILALFIGEYLDERYGTKPLFLLILIGIAFIISIYSLWKNVKSYIKDNLPTGGKEK